MGLEKTSFAPILELEPIEWWYTRHQSEGIPFTIEFDEYGAGKGVKIKIYDISEHKEDKPFLVINNVGKGCARRIKVEITNATVTNKERSYPFNSGSIFVEDSYYDLPPGDFLVLQKQDKSKNLNFKEDFAVRLTYESEFTAELLVKTFEVFVKKKQLKGGKTVYFSPICKTIRT